MTEKELIEMQANRVRGLISNIANHPNINENQFKSSFWKLSLELLNNDMNKLIKQIEKAENEGLV